MLERVQKIIDRITLECIGIEFQLNAFEDKKGCGRIYLQVSYVSPCTHSGKHEIWKSGKHYLSEHMTDDEIVKKSYVAFEQCVKHEIMEGFKVDGKILFNPHVNFEELLAISHKEVKRK